MKGLLSFFRSFNTSSLTKVQIGLYHKSYAISSIPHCEIYYLQSKALYGQNVAKLVEGGSSDIYQYEVRRILQNISCQKFHLFSSGDKSVEKINNQTNQFRRHVERTLSCSGYVIGKRRKHTPFQGPVVTLQHNPTSNRTFNLQQLRGGQSFFPARS